METASGLVALVRTPPRAHAATLNELANGASDATIDKSSHRAAIAVPRASKALRSDATRSAEVPDCVAVT